MNKMKYCNDIIVRLEELLFNELSVMAHWKVELVGADFIQSCDIKGDTLEDIVQNCIKEIENAGLVESMAHTVGGKGIKLELKMKNCCHLPKERTLMEHGVKPYICPIANMVLDQLIEKLNYETVYLAEIKIDEKAGECRAWSAIYETEEQVGMVSDWHNE